LLAAGRKTDPHSWALLADTHLAANRSQLGRGINMTDHFTTVSTELLALPQRPAGVFIAGDCAFNSGETGDYAVLAELLKPIRADQLPVHLALGNHDQREHFWQALEQEGTAKRPLKEKQAALISTARVNWFMLDSLEKTLSTPGLLGPDQLQWLAEALDANRRKPAIVLVHHNPGLNGQMGLKDTLAFYQVIRPRKQVKAYIYGHTHKWTVEREESGMHLINLPPVAYIFREGDPAGWVHARVERDGMNLQLNCLDKAHPQHQQVVDLKWRA
jgi:3',5'-cyclic AMP phosphodiesterase CpdA